MKRETKPDSSSGTTSREERGGKREREGRQTGERKKNTAALSSHQNSRSLLRIIKHGQQKFINGV
jgi:hypothetical protein